MLTDQDPPRRFDAWHPVALLGFGLFSLLCLAAAYVLRGDTLGVVSAGISMLALGLWGFIVGALNYLQERDLRANEARIRDDEAWITKRHQETRQILEDVRREHAELVAGRDWLRQFIRSWRSRPDVVDALIREMDGTDAPHLVDLGRVVALVLDNSPQEGAS